jgi:geranylgeranyl diphosphate synthase type I
MEMRTLEGQALDLGWARDHRWDVRVEDYLRMGSLKTAYYSCACPLALGAICGHAPEETVDGLKVFGMKAGLAFQIQDDLLNLVADAQGTGKDFRSDITEGKRTLVMVHALAHLEGPARSRLIEILSAHTTDEAGLAEAVALAEQAGSIAHARETADHLTHEAKEILLRLSIDSEAREVLRSMADFFVERKS